MLTRRGLRLVAVTATLVASGVSLVVPAATPAGAAPRGVATVGAATSGSVGYYVGKAVCPAPRKGAAACLAMRKVRVAAGTRGAVAQAVPASVSTATIGPAGGLTPKDLTTAYGLPASGGAGQTVAIVDAYDDPQIGSDLAAYSTEYGLPACKLGTCLRVVDQTGGSALPAGDTTGWSVEEALDVETVHSVCRSCKIILVEANSSANADLAAAENEAVALGAGVVSNSFGAPESASTAAVQSAYNHPGTVIVASAGDDGYDSFDREKATDSPSIPASYNTVVAVGGTSLYLNQSGTRASETVWNDDGAQDVYQRIVGVALGASGGGCSSSFSAPAWQSAEPDWAASGCGAHRLVSDVAAVADPVTGVDIYQTHSCASCGAAGWQTMGGTSLAAPLIAAAFALAGGAKGVSYPAQTLYSHQSSAYDVTTGGDGWCAGEGAPQCGNPNTEGYGIVDCDYASPGTLAPGDMACDAGAGYDGPTGVGTPKGLALFGA